MKPETGNENTWKELMDDCDDSHQAQGFVISEQIIIMLTEL